MSAICRGCGGTGLDHKLSPREVQMVRGIFYCKRPLEANKSRGVASLEIVPVDRADSHRQFATGPLASILERIEHYMAIGYVECDHDVEWLRSLACSWCHGTGVPQLSTATMRAVVAHG